MDIHVIDGLYDNLNLNTAIQNSYNYEWLFNRGDANSELYWTMHMYGDIYFTEQPLQNLKKFKFNEIETLWNEFSKKFNVSKDNLNSCYVNGLTFGVEAYPHVDHKDKGHVSVITYLCENWNSHWGGETTFFDKDFVHNDPSNEVFYQHDIIKSVLPKFNRMVLFDANITHAVRPISKSYKGLRKTLMFKLKNISIQDLMENYKCS